MKHSARVFTAGFFSMKLLFVASEPSSFDLIVSKYGYGDSLKKNHHFFHWQASTKYFRGMVNVDDYEDEENGLTFYVVN